MSEPICDENGWTAEMYRQWAHECRSRIPMQQDPWQRAAYASSAGKAEQRARELDAMEASDAGTRH
jgi:hypothetical protein